MEREFRADPDRFISISAYNTSGNPEEYKNPVGPNAWVVIAIAHDIEANGDDSRHTKLQLAKDITGKLLAMRTDYKVTQTNGEVTDATIMPLGPGSNTASTEHNIDMYVICRYLADKLGVDGAAYRETARGIANFLRAPSEKGGALVMSVREENRARTVEVYAGRGVKNVYDFTKDGERSDNSFDYNVATDVQAWMASLAQIYKDDFPNLDPRTFVNFLERSSAVTVDFRGQRAGTLDYFDFTRKMKELERLNKEAHYWGTKIGSAGEQPGEIGRLIDSGLIKPAYSEYMANLEKAEKEINNIRNAFRQNPVAAVEFMTYMITAYYHSAERAKEAGDTKGAEYYLNQAKFYENERNKFIITENGQTGLVYSDKADIPKDDSKEVTPPATISASSTAAAAASKHIKTRDGKQFDPFRIQAPRPAVETPKPQVNPPARQPVQNVKPIAENRAVGAVPLKPIGPGLYSDNRGRLFDKNGKEIEIMTAGFNLSSEQIAWIGAKVSDVWDWTRDNTFMGRIFGRAKQAAPVVEPSVRSETTGLYVSYYGEKGIQGDRAYTFDIALKSLENLFTGTRQKETSTMLDFLFSRKETPKVSGLLPSAFDVKHGNMQENNDPGGPTSWALKALIKDIETNGDTGNQKLSKVVETADLLRFIMKTNGNIGIIPTGPGAKGAATEHILDHFMIFEYLGRKITGQDGQRFRDASQKIANFLDTPVGQGGALLPDGTLAAGILDIDAFIKGDRSANAVNYSKYTDVFGWGGSIAFIYSGYFRNLDPMAQADYALNNLKVTVPEVNINGRIEKNVEGFDFTNEAGRNAIKRSPMISVEWSVYILNTLRYAALKAESVGNRAKAEYYRSMENHFKGQISRLHIELDGKKGMIYATSNDAQKINTGQVNKTSENATGSIAMAPTVAWNLYNKGIDLMQRIDLSKGEVSSMPEKYSYSVTITNIPGTKFTIRSIIQSDAAQKKELYRETFEAGKLVRIERRVDLPLPKTMSDYIRSRGSELINTDRIKDRLFENKTIYDRVLNGLEGNKYDIFIEEKPGTDIASIKLYTGGYKFGYLADNSLFIYKRLNKDVMSRLDILGFDEAKFRQNLEQKAVEIFGANARAKRFIEDFRSRGAMVGATLEFNMNQPSAMPQKYIGFSYTDSSGKEHRLGRLQAGAFGLSVDLIEHDSKGNVTFEDPKLQKIIDLAKSDSIKKSLVGPGKPFRDQAELDKLITALAKDKKNVIAHTVFSIAENGTGAIQDKKTWTSVYYSGRETLRID
ncbi:MAG: hypothetical protein AAB267_09485, partial [Candidatus Desantisbacteria bacterium]